MKTRGCATTSVDQTAWLKEIKIMIGKEVTLAIQFFFKSWTTFELLNESED